MRPYQGTTWSTAVSSRELSPCPSAWKDADILPRASFCSIGNTLQVLKDAANPLQAMLARSMQYGLRGFPILWLQ